MIGKILIVEDDQTQNQVLANFLRKESFETVCAYSLREARALLDASIHLIVLDVMLPDGNGLEYLREIRKQSNVPVIVLTALDDEYTQVMSFDLSADEYVDKPVSPIVMVKRIQALFKRIYESDTTVPIGDYIFDFSRFEVRTKSGASIKLTTKEISIIQHLYQQKGHVVTRDSILNAVWGYDYIGEDRLIDTHMKNIRKKLGSDFIITVKGVGYRIMSDGTIEP